MKAAYNYKDTQFNDVHYHSNKIKPGDVFVCVKGYRTDGHKYISKAIENGAVAAVVQNHQTQHKIPQFQVNDTRLVLAKLADYI